MQKEIVNGFSPKSISQRAVEIAVEAAWQQWSVLNPSVKRSVSRIHPCVIDPEALVLSSLALANHESRLLDLVGWCAQRTSTLLSVQRMRTIQKLFLGVEDRMGWFAHWAVRLGNDRRWSSISTQPSSIDPRPAKGPDLPRLDDPATLLLRLRAGFGVGVKPDLTAYLMSQRGNPRSATEIAGAIGYTDKTIRIAVRELLMAGVVEQTAEYPVKYSAREGFPESFLQLLYGNSKNSVPSWCYWAHVLSFLVRLSSWKSSDSATNNYLASSRARDLFAEYEGTFREIRLRMPRPEPHPGESYLAVFGEFVEQLGSWVEDNKND